MDRIEEWLEAEGSSSWTDEDYERRREIVSLLVWFQDSLAAPDDGIVDQASAMLQRLPPTSDPSYSPETTRLLRAFRVHLEILSGRPSRQSLALAQIWTRPVHAGAVEIIVDVASYIGTAAAGGIIGNRADDAVSAAGRMFHSVITRWRKRNRPAADEPLTEPEAIDAAIAAAVAHYGLENVSYRSSEKHNDGGWAITLAAKRNGTAETLRVLVPPGDPAIALILIL